ncbi:RNA polymerase sigma-70 factor [Echinicola marina]|uniref:RNA polymerase sigma-70 factor n=1 Tax=Echinicola marina TaxID=2859768 RepID=UPI001CF6C43D|nr:RNA polymerase sigma-70 factor [Echinicola marina]UCS92109.1 RNA polymerase sigma-70 factor [Echinicola marina]
MSQIYEKELSEDCYEIAAMKEGSWEAFEHLYNKYWEKLFKLSVRVTGDEELSKDFVQEIFLDLWNRRQSLSIKNPYAYLYQATKYRFVEHIRRQDLQKKFIAHFNEVLHLSNDVEEKIYFEELHHQIDSRLVELPSRCREIFTLSRYQHLSNQEIANRLGISKSTVENQLNKALNHLRKSADLGVAMMFILGIL